MARSEWAERRYVRLSRRYAVEMIVGPGGFTCEWHPGFPTGRLSKSEWSAYRQARDALAADVSARLGEPVLMVELR